MSYFHCNRRGIWPLVAGLLIATMLFIMWLGFFSSANPPIPDQKVISENQGQSKDQRVKQPKVQTSHSSSGNLPRTGKVSYLGTLCDLPTKTEIDNWLDRRGRSPRNLLAAAALGGAEDKRLILESLKNNPNDPATLMRVLQHDLLPERREELYETLRRNAPDNAMPGLLEAARLLVAGKSEGALAALLGAAQRPEFDSYIKNIKADAELMLRDMGRDELGAAAMSTLGIRDPILEEIAYRVSSAKVENSPPLLIAARISALEALSANPTTVMGKIVSIGALKDLINESKNYVEELGPYLNRPFSEYNESILQQRNDASRYGYYVTDPGKILAALPIETQVDFFRRAAKLGEVDAVDWLLSVAESE